MTRSRRSIASLTTLALLIAASWFTAAPAQAAYTATVAGGVLTLDGTEGDDTATVTCESGQVKIDGADPSSGASNCSAITAVVINGLGGADYIFLDSLNAVSFPALTTQTVNGGAGADQIVAAPQPGAINGGDDDDRIYPAVGNQTIDGGTGFDTVFDLAANGATATDSLIVTSPGGSDPLVSIEKVFLTGTNAGETFDLTGFSGATQVNASNGDDTVLGAPGPDFVMGGSGNDTINGNGGDDTLVPNDGDDIVDGGLGTDTLLLGDNGFTLTDTSATGPFIGSDTLDGFELATLLMFGPGTLDASGFTGDATVTGSDGDDILITGPGADSITARSGADVIRSGTNNDTLKGEEGKDHLIAGPGNDRLIGGPNKDDCNGGPGHDILRSCP